MATREKLVQHKRSTPTKINAFIKKNKKTKKNNETWLRILREKGKRNRICLNSLQTWLLGQQMENTLS